jgi:hypothetical protein
VATGKYPFEAVGVNEEAKRAFGAAFDAMSGWRSEMADVAQRNSTEVFDKMGNAAKALGWPAEFVDMTREQMQQGTKMQLQMMDQIMDVWEKQMKSPTGPNSMKGFPGVPGAGGSPGMPPFPGFDFGASPMAPLQFWMQATEMWQKSWQQALTSGIEAQSSMMGQSQDNSRPKR